tara:strand:+ start:2911 stop:3666 length:756 start_codon:yes stop_codon:yes gene_type:complete
MILRRISTAFRKQDWFTVAVETLIVVFGVFIGLQVNNWNAARVSRSDAADLSSRLRIEAEETRAEIAVYLALNELILTDAKRLAVRLGDSETCLTMDDETKALILGIGDFPPPRFSLSSANEALETGRLSLIGSPEIRDSVREMADQMAFMDNQWQRYVRVKQETEKAAYTAAGFRLMTEDNLEVRPGVNIVAGLDQYQITTPERVCGNTEVIALVSNAAVTQHLYSIYVAQVADRLDAYTVALSGTKAQP